MFDEEIKNILMGARSDNNDDEMALVREKKSTQQYHLVAAFLDAYVKTKGAEVSPTIAGEFLIKEKWSHVYKKSE